VTKELAAVTTTHRLTLLFSPEIVYETNMTIVSHPRYFSVSPLKIKLKGRHINTIDVIEAESRRC
jgi:hypothetical protein